MPEPLKSKDRHGAPFTRPPEIEACLASLESVDAAARLLAFAVDVGAVVGEEHRLERRVLVDLIDVAARERILGGRFRGNR